METKSIICKVYKIYRVVSRSDDRANPITVLVSIDEYREYNSEKEAMENLPNDDWDEYTILPIFKKRFEWE